MKKKGFVYRATMSFGFLFLFGYAFGEIAYWKYYRQYRDKQIQEVSLHASCVVWLLLKITIRLGLSKIKWKTYLLRINIQNWNFSDMYY